MQVTNTPWNYEQIKEIHTTIQSTIILTGTFKKTVIKTVTNTLLLLQIIIDVGRVYVTSQSYFTALQTNSISPKTMVTHVGGMASECKFALCTSTKMIIVDGSLKETMETTFPDNTHKLNGIYCNATAVYAVFDEKGGFQTLFASSKQSATIKTATLDKFYNVQVVCFQ